MRFADVRDSQKTEGTKFMEMSVRVPQNWTKGQVEELRNGMNAAFSTYATLNPLNSRWDPVAHFEVFPAERPFTGNGEVRGLTDKGMNDWWNGAIVHLMVYLQSQFEGRGVVMYTVHDEKSYHLPMLDDCKAA